MTLMSRYIYSILTCNNIPFSWYSHTNYSQDQYTLCHYFFCSISTNEIISPFVTLFFVPVITGSLAENTAALI